VFDRCGLGAQARAQVAMQRDHVAEDEPEDESVQYAQARGDVAGEIARFADVFRAVAAPHPGRGRGGHEEGDQHEARGDGEAGPHARRLHPV